MRITEVMQSTNIATELIRRFGGRQIRFRDLPNTAKKAIRTRAAEHLEPGTSMRIDPNRSFGYVEIPIDALKQAMFQNLQANEGSHFKNFDEYHQWYISHGDTPNHTEVWPIELETDDPEGWGLISDGSHRFHSYVRNGVPIIPAIY